MSCETPAGRIKMKKRVTIEYPKNYAMKYPLHSACRRGNDEQVEELLKTHSDQLSYVNKKDNKGRTALMVAILEDQEDIVDLVLNHGASAHIPDKTGQTCLMAAVRTGSLDLVRKFIKLNVHIDQTDENDDTALLWGIEEGDDDIVTELCANGANVNSHKGDKCALRKTLEKGSEAKRKGAYKRIIHILMDHGFDTTWKDYNNLTLSEWAESLKRMKNTVEWIKPYVAGN